MDQEPTSTPVQPIPMANSNQDGATETVNQPTVAQASSPSNYDAAVASLEKATQTLSEQVKLISNEIVALGKAQAANPYAGAIGGGNPVDPNQLAYQRAEQQRDIRTMLSLRLQK